MEQWENNYYISAIAGATNGSSLVVMSKGMSQLMAVLEASHIYYIHMKNLWVVPTAVSVTDQTYTQLNVLC
jgi:hypothetical protein